MKIAVFGLGNVGLVAALGLCEQGHEVLGFDINPDKIQTLRQGRTYLFEKGLDELLIKHKHRFTPSLESENLRGIDCFYIAVGSPALPDGNVSLEQVSSTCDEISRLMINNPNCIVLLRSTVPPGTVESLVLPKLEASGVQFDLIYHPEFLREGSAIEDFLRPDIHVVGVGTSGLPPMAKELLANCDRVFKVPFKSAEMLKYFNNAFHALKVTFANEMAVLARAMQVDVEPLFEAFLADTKLNISEQYLHPGFAFGGPCLTKDVAALQHLGLRHKIQTPVLNAIVPSNQAHIRRTFELIEKFRPLKIVVFGLSFKSGTDDLRASPVVELVQMLISRPKYLPKREVWVVESNEMKLSMGSDDLYRSEKIPAVKPDCIILGSRELDEEQANWVKSQNCRIYDLCLTGSASQLSGRDVVLPYEVL